MRTSSRWPRVQVRALLRLVLAYLLAGLVGTVVLFGRGGGHADVPLTMWPEYLLLAPVLPILVAARLAPPLRAREVMSAAAFIATFVLAWIGTRPLDCRPAARSSRSLTARR